MNKIVKGAIAGGIGVALLLGGAGTLAYWTDQTPAGAGATITAGELSMGAPQDGAWTVSNGSVSDEPVADIATFRMVPGDTLTYTTTVDVTAVGDNLTATASLGTAAITASDDQNSADVALAGQLTDSASLTVNGTQSTTIDASSSAVPVEVTATISWPFGGSTSPANDNPAMTGAVDFSNFNVVVEQDQP